MSAEEIEALRDGMREQRQAIREALAADLGGDPEDYDAERYLREASGETSSDS